MDLSEISIIPLLPPNLASDKNVRMVCEAFDEELRRIIADIPGIAVIPNLVLKKITDNLLLDLLAWQFHVDFYDPAMPLEIKSELILKSLNWHTRKGTPSVVEEIVSTVFSKAEIQEWFDYGGLPYRFRIGTEEEMPDTAVRNNLIRAINSIKNTRSFLENITSIIIFEDGFNVKEYLRIIVRVNSFEDIFQKRFKFNGAAKFDGKTVNNKVVTRGKFNGVIKFNGDLKFNGIGKAFPAYKPNPPFKFSSGILDKLSIEIPENNFSNKAILNEDISIGIRKYHYFNGVYKFDGTIKFNSKQLIPLG